MIPIKTLMVMGVVDSLDNQLATVELSTSNTDSPIITTMPVSAFPCEVYEGKVFYVVKLPQEYADAIIVC